MAVRIVRLGSPRVASEGLRIGTVRRPPRGVLKEEFSTGDWYDVWFPNLAPSLETVKLVQSAASEREWAVFVRAYRQEMSVPAAKHDLALLAAMSHMTNFSVGCYCENEARCHRSLLKEILVQSGAKVS